jgi:hypothetical protein
LIFPITDYEFTRWTYCEARHISKTKQGEAAVIGLVTVVPVAVMVSVWSDVQAVQEITEQRKQDASQLGMPGNYHTLLRRSSPARHGGSSAFVNRT